MNSGPAGSRPRIVLITTLVMSIMTSACSAGAEPPSDGAPPQETTLPAATLDEIDAIAAFFGDPTATNLTDAVSAIGSATPEGSRLHDLLEEVGATLVAEPGRATIAAPIGFNQHRQITIRTPDGYDPARAWPLIIAYHSWGGTADRMLDRMEDLLGDDIERFVVAAPDDYRQTVIDAPPPVSAEHISIWREVTTRRHIDSDRIYVAGYSLGGEAVMTTSTFHGHRLAGGVGWAATSGLPPDVEGMYGWFAPNLQDIPLLHVWGSEDDLNIPGLNGRRAEHRLADLAQAFGEVARDAGLDHYIGIEVTGADHGTIRPPREGTLTLLESRRGPVPTRIEHLFRYVHQADTAWVEGHEWSGPAWLGQWPSPEIEAGALEPAAEAAVIRDLLGAISATAVDNHLTVATTHLSDLTVWLPEGLIDFDRPVTVSWNGTIVYSGVVVPDPAVALVQAHRTRDTSRLRWAGVRIVDGRAHLVTVDDVFPEVARGIVPG